MQPKTGNHRSCRALSAAEGLARRGVSRGRRDRILFLRPPAGDGYSRLHRYAWFWSFLDEPTRLRVREALVSKGLQASLTRRGWFAGVNNWNQVYNGGVTVGALAVAESEPDLAAKIITRAVNVVPNAMREYAPDGAYPEGPSY